MGLREFLRALRPSLSLRARRLRSKAMDRAHANALRIDGYGSPEPGEWSRRFPRAARTLAEHAAWVAADAAAAAVAARPQASVAQLWRGGAFGVR
jgi:hypothetical protein